MKNPYKEIIEIYDASICDWCKGTGKRKYTYQPNYYGAGHHEGKGVMDCRKCNGTGRKQIQPSMSDLPNESGVYNLTIKNLEVYSIDDVGNFEVEIFGHLFDILEIDGQWSPVKKPDES